MPSRALLLIALGLLAGFAVELPAGEPLHVRIDQLIEAKLGDWEAQPRSGDAEFVRRVYLDFAGRIPTADEARAFLDDAAADKREALIDRLLEGPEYPRRMQELFNVMLLERRGDDVEWAKFLRTAFESNMAWDAIARALVRPNADDEATRGSAYFLSVRLVSEGAMAPVDVPGLTRDVGRLLAGVDLGCAQCHDHVSVNDYRQVDYQGLHMVFENVQTRRDVEFPAVAEKLLTKKKGFMSVFTQIPMETAPRIPGGGEIEIMSFEKGEEYVEPPDRTKRTPGVPKFSPLGELAAGLASADNELFSKNIANRLWFVMMGRGLVEPLDLQHSENPPTHPELLDLMARQFAGHGFDVKWLLRELALSETYQRTGVLPEGHEAPPRESYAAANQRRLSAEQLFWSTLTATGELERRREQLAKANDKEKVKQDEIAADLSGEEVVRRFDDLKKLHKRFLGAFANPPKEPETDFEPTVEAALFMMHDERVVELIAVQPGNLADRLSKIEEDRLADELFLTLLSRPATGEDQQDVAEFLEANEERRPEAVAELIWAVLASTEFVVNH